MVVTRTDTSSTGSIVTRGKTSDTCYFLVSSEPNMQLLSTRCVDFSQNRRGQYTYLRELIKVSAKEGNTNTCRHVREKWLQQVWLKVKHVRLSTS